jgi:phosphatidylethanolamine-binding protein (PEBP) family uncharacterized protein
MTHWCFVNITAQGRGLTADNGQSTSPQALVQWLERWSRIHGYRGGRSP